MNFRGFMPSFQAANTVASTLQDRQQAQQQQQAKAALVKILSQLAGSQNGVGAPSASAPPMLPGAMPPGGVSPPMGNMPPAGGAPGGAGPASPMGGAPLSPPPPMPGSALPPGLDYGRLAAAVQNAGLNPGAQGEALQMLMKTIQPAQNNAFKLEMADKNYQNRSALQDQLYGNKGDLQKELYDEKGNLLSQGDASKLQREREALSVKQSEGGANRSSRESIASGNRSSREDIAKLNRELRSTTPTGDKQYDALKEAGKAARAAYNAKPNKENQEALKHAAAALVDYASTKSGGGNGGSSASAAKPAYSQEDLEYTAKQNNMTVDEVKKKLGVN